MGTETKRAYVMSHEEVEAVVIQDIHVLHLLYGDGTLANVVLFPHHNEEVMDHVKRVYNEASLRGYYAGLAGNALNEWPMDWENEGRTMRILNDQWMEVDYVEWLPCMSDASRYFNVYRNGFEDGIRQSIETLKTYVEYDVIED